MAFRAYTNKEIRDAAMAYGVDPETALWIYAKESSSGTNPTAMKARLVKRKRDSTFVRGPFQLEDGTTADLIRENKLGNVDVEDPDVHLDLAMRQLKKLQDRYRGDSDMVKRAFHGFGVDELGVTDRSYVQTKPRSFMPEEPAYAPSADEMDDMLMGSDDMGSSPPDDMLGIPEMPPPMSQAFNRNPMEYDPLGLPMYVSNATGVKAGQEFDLHRYLSAMVDDELQGKDYVSAA